MRNKSPPRHRAAVAMVMAIVMLLASLPVNLAEAAIVTTDQVIEGSTASHDRARVMAFMAREDVRRELEALGIDPDEAARRAAALSDDEIRQIAGRLDELPAGQSHSGQSSMPIGKVPAEAIIIVSVLGIIFLSVIIYVIWRIFSK